MRVLAGIGLILALAGCWEEPGIDSASRKKIEHEMASQAVREARDRACADFDRMQEETLRARDLANGGLTGGAKTPRVAACLTD